MLKEYNYTYLDADSLRQLADRNLDSNNKVKPIVESIISEVKLNGDVALKNYAKQFDGIILDKLFIDKNEINSLANSISTEEKSAIEVAYKNIKKFHESQINFEGKIETTNGVTCWRENRAIEKVGLYVPGGSAVLPSTFLMLAIPAKIAGCKEIIVCSPPQKNNQNQIGTNGYLAYVATLLGIEKIFLVGGAQAIAAMAYGTETITKVDKIFGPGNQYVTMAKTLVQTLTQTAIDMPAGPSEVLVIADDSANPDFVAADLLAQAEHGTDSQAVLVCTSKDIIKKTNIALSKQLALLPRKDIAAKAIENSFAIYVDNLNDGMAFSNYYAPEHLIIASENWEKLIPLIVNAGSVFLGNYTPESAGDYASGTNHTLPTSAYAKAYSGVSLDSFVKKITFQHINPLGIQNLGPCIQTLAEIEGLQGHKNAVTLRINELKK